MEFFSLRKPNLEGVNEGKTMEALFRSDGQFLRKFIDNANSPEYSYWDKIQYKKPVPEGFSREELWFAIKLSRKVNSLQTVIKNETGGYFTWFKIYGLEKFYHEIDMNMGGELFILKADFDKFTKQKLVSRGVMEEAIASSQLEGASTSRALAKQFLREGRKPRNTSEQMILNSYVTMKSLEEVYKDKQMSLDLFYELHGMITNSTMTDEGVIPRLRKDGEDIFVVDSGNGVVYHKAPKMSFVMDEINRLIKFANDELEQGFVHPITKAIMLHFWIGYLHPFTDGNGRLARFIFYWYLLKNGYWAFSYLPISKIIKKAPAQYSMAYVYSEQDDYDMTYFIDFNIKKIRLAMSDFKNYLSRVTNKNKKMSRVAETQYNLNERQIQLLQYLSGTPEEKTSVRAHMSIYRISRITATNDLKKLVYLELLESKKTGRNVYYYSTEKVTELFK